MKKLFILLTLISTHAISEKINNIDGITHKTKQIVFSTEAEKTIDTGESLTIYNRMDWSRLSPPTDYVKNKSSNIKSNKCHKLELVEDQPELLIMINSNSPYLGATESLYINPPSWAKCAYIQVLAAIETYAPLVGTTTAGAQFQHPVSDLKMASVKVLGRGSFSNFASENMTTMIIPLDDTGNLYFKQLNIRNPSSNSSTFTALVVILGGWYY